MKHAVILAIATAIALPAVSSQATANADREWKTENSVRACGRISSKCKTTELRKGPKGYQYRTASGKWRYCKGDCRDSIRHDYLDFWFYQGG